jgi:hypothetical protein
MVTRAQLDRLSAPIDELADDRQVGAVRAKLRAPGEPLSDNERRGINIAVYLAGLPTFGEEFVARHVAAFMAQIQGGLVDTQPIFCAIRGCARGQRRGAMTGAATVMVVALTGSASAARVCGPEPSRLHFRQASLTAPCVHRLGRRFSNSFCCHHSRLPKGKTLESRGGARNTRWRHAHEARCNAGQHQSHDSDLEHCAHGLLP